jgi:Flp pilus assembly protein TadB
MRALVERAEAVRSLAALLRSGLTLRAALVIWPDESPCGLRPSLERAARRIRLGDGAARALSVIEGWDQDGSALAAIAGVHSRLGGDAAAMLDELAAAIDRRRGSLGEARAAGAGARLSGRLVAALPLLFVPTLPASRAPLLDPMGLVMVSMGGALAVGGMLWIERLFPKPPQRDDPVASLCDLLAGVMSGGAPFHLALSVIAEHSSGALADPLGRALRRVRLGASWSDALRRSGVEGLVRVGTTLERADSLGLPVALALGSLAGERRAEASRRFNEQMRKAPVLMMLPLTLCVLPAFMLLALGPFLRGLALEP